ncbi:hypothetical protein ACFL6U_25775 [Planctomycetota bacterium]
MPLTSPFDASLVRMSEDPWTEEPHARELFDFKKDPYEQINLVDDPAHAKTTRQLAQLLRDGWRTALPSNITDSQ